MRARAQSASSMAPRQSSAPWTAICWRAASMLAYMSTCGLVLWVMWTMPSRRARLTRSPRAMSTDDWVRPLMSLCVLTTAASAPAVMASTGSSGQKRRCGPHAWSVTNGTPASCASVPMAGRSAPRPL